MKFLRVLALTAFSALAVVGMGEFGTPLTAADAKADKKAERIKAKEEAKKKADDAAKKAEDAKTADEAQAADAAKIAADKKAADEAKKVATAAKPAVSRDASAIAKLIDTQIDARLKIEPYPDISFETVMELTTGCTHIRAMKT